MVEIIPRPLVKFPIWLNILFYLSLVILLATIISYFVIDQSLDRAQKTLQDLQELISKTKSSEAIALEKEVFNYQKKIRNFSQLIPQHIISSNFFNFLEKSTLPKIWFSQVNLDCKNNKIQISGRTNDFSTLGHQLQILEKETLVQKTDLTQISIGKTGEVEFTLDLSLDQKILRW